MKMILLLMTAAFFAPVFVPFSLAAGAAEERCSGSVPNDGGMRNRKYISSAFEEKLADFIVQSTSIPGISIAVVKGSELIYARGFGYRNLDACDPVDPNTRFYLKSTTKSFTGMAAALLHEEGEIDLDAPITEYLPNLTLPEGINAAQISLRDHFTHTQPYLDSGLSYRTAFPGNLPEQEFVTHVNNFSQAADIKFQYSNFGPVFGAHAIGEHTGINWRDLISDRIFAPAGMDNSFTSIADAEIGPMAVSYIQGEDGEFIATLTKTDAQMHAAGGAVSTANDLSRWIILNLNEGSIEGVQALPKRVVEHAHSRQVYLDWDFLEYHRFAHGLGIYSADYDGDLLMHHFGGETHVSFMPEHDLGVVILTNAIADGVAVTHRLAASIYDMLLDKPDVEERIAERLEAIRVRQSNANQRKSSYLVQLKEDAPDGPAVFAPSELVGHYIDPRLGEMIVTESAVALNVRFGEMSGPLTRLSGDSFLADIGMWGDLPELFVFRHNRKKALVLDWGGRIFSRTED